MQTDQRLEAFRDGRLAVLVASTVADEGLDVPRLGRLVLAYPGRAKGRLTQRLGRLMRPHPDKDGAILYDVVDERVAPLRRQWRERCRLYREVTGAVPDGVSDPDGFRLAFSDTTSPPVPGG
ncbi:DEAD/DEAH box helicase [Haliangium ochraceum]|uniref:DEAD/DEAH box helicase n=1 Tax=Haliangium ochraceum TaxID=80816 RepID=UPI00019BA6E4|nr:helicase-related protein [Haliangium ochraceum]